MMKYLSIFATLLVIGVTLADPQYGQFHRRPYYGQLHGSIGGHGTHGSIDHGTPVDSIDHADPHGGGYKPVKYKRCETVTTNAVKYSTKPVVKTTYVYSTHVTKVPSTYKVYITKTSHYVDFSTVCDKVKH